MEKRLKQPTVFEKCSKKVSKSYTPGNPDTSNAVTSTYAFSFGGDFSPSKQENVDISTGRKSEGLPRGGYRLTRKKHWDQKNGKQSAQRRLTMLLYTQKLTKGNHEATNPELDTRKTTRQWENPMPLLPQAILGVRRSYGGNRMNVGTA